MRKVRDYDSELKALEERTRLLRQRKIQQFGELIEATGADALDPDRLAGALLAATLEKNEATIAAWTNSGARFLARSSRSHSRRASPNRKSDGKASSGAASS